MEGLHLGGRVQINSAIPGFHRETGIIASITEPFVRGERAREEALRELRLYVVRLDDGRQFRFRGKDLSACEEPIQRTPTERVTIAG